MERVDSMIKQMGNISSKMEILRKDQERKHS